MQGVEENKKKLLEVLQAVEMESYFPTYLGDLLAYWPIMGMFILKPLV